MLLMVTEKRFIDTTMVMVNVGSNHEIKHAINQNITLFTHWPMGDVVVILNVIFKQFYSPIVIP